MSKVVLYYLLLSSIACGIAIGNDRLWGVLKSIEYSPEDRAYIESLTRDDLEWLINYAHLREAYSYSGPRIFFLIGKAIKGNEGSLDEQSLELYHRRVVAMSKMLEGEPYHEMVLGVLRSDFDHPIVDRYLEEHGVAAPKRIEAKLAEITESDFGDGVSKSIDDGDETQFQSSGSAALEERGNHWSLLVGIVGFIGILILLIKVLLRGRV